MKIKAIILVLLSVFGAAVAGYLSTMEGYLRRHHLFDAYQQRIKYIKERDLFVDRLPQLDESIKLTIKSPLNETYKKTYLNDLIKEFPLHAFKDGTEFNSLYAVRYDFSGSIKYLEGVKNRNFVQNFQLMVLWHVYQPEKIATKLYAEMAEQNHEELSAYFKAGKRQSSWRAEEYQEKTGDNYQACYSDLKCLLSIIPYWREWNEDIDVYIPCDTAQKYNMIVYFDGAGGGHGAQSFMISDCDLYDKYAYDKDLEAYTDMLFYEGIPESGGSIRFYYQAKAVYNSFMRQYSPKFDLETQKRWDNFPYTEWAVASYYNFAKYNEVLNYGIGYKEALKKLTEHYVKNFGVSEESAYNTALYTLKIPSMDSSALVTSNDLRYMLLTGKPWNEIEKAHKKLKGYKDFLDLSIAYPENLKEIILLGKKEKDFDIDYPNWFGKTPLMTAVQYGHLDSVKLLLENGADINRQTLDVECWSYLESLCIQHGKRTALMYAAQEGQFEIVKYLLKTGADINLQDTQGLTAYDYMLAMKLTYNPRVKPTINGGDARYWVEEKRKSAFSPEQVEELTPLLRVQHPCVNELEKK